jgi:hypothetical protein
MLRPNCPTLVNKQYIKILGRKFILLISSQLFCMSCLLPEVGQLAETCRKKYKIPKIIKAFSCD